MTVTYTGDIANGGKFVSFWRVLIRWRGSLYKLIWQDLVCYCMLFLAINLIHTHALSTQMQLLLQKLKNYLSTNISLFPVPFVLSFFVDQVATKWWHQYQLLPSPDTLAIYTNATIPGKDEKSRMIRRTIVRYAILSLVLTLRNISMKIKRRFPTLKHVEEGGLILEEEKVHYDKLGSQVTANNWMPLVWAANVATHAKSLKKVSSDHCLRLLISELTAHRDKLGTLVSYDLVNIPLVYTQTMVVVVMSYIIITLISHQSPTGTIGSGFTISSLTDFIIYVGLMKVATVMLNPFGEDDDDFELNAIIDRHIKAAYMIVDEMHEEEPEVVKDAFWDEIVPNVLPYTVGSLGERKLEPNCYEEETHETMKQPKNRLSGLRRNVMAGINNKSVDVKDDSENRRSAKNNLSKNGNNFVNQRHNNASLYKAGSSTARFGKEVDAEVYDCPHTAEAIHELQQPSTSKQDFYWPKRCPSPDDEIRSQISKCRESTNNFTNDGKRLQ